MGSGPSLASNLLNNEGTAVFYRSTSWSRNRVTNGRYTVVERAGYKIGFFVLNDPAQAAVISASNGEFITARDWNDTAAEQITALQNAGCRCHPCDCLHRPGGRLAEGPAEPGRDGHY